MKPIDEFAQGRRRSFLVRAEILEAGGSDRAIASRVKAGLWTNPHAGVYRAGPAPETWWEKLEAAVCASGPGALVSHRAAFKLWDLEGFEGHLVEITVPYESAPVPAGVIRHRTRREMPREIVAGLPVTDVGRTLLDASAQLPTLVIMKGIDSALRRDLTSPAVLWRVVSEQGGRGVPGTGRFRSALSTVTDVGGTGSPAEVEALTAMRRAGLPDPQTQYEVVTPSGKRYLIDFAWPELDKGVEIDGLGAHSGPQKLERDLQRQNDLMDAGIQLRRFTAAQVRRSPREVVEAIRRFLTDDGKL